MPPSTDHIHAVTEAYLARHPDERSSLGLLFAALDGADAPTSRKTCPAHVTCSAILINGERHVLHIAHKASGKLLAPGGHNEPADRHLRDAALRELHEEAGISPSAVVPLAGYEGVPLDIDVHVSRDKIVGTRGVR
ncbi:NUDIX domain-containing protein [Streptomyces zagrosensis]|uniref:8-oxo-dGTP pyrophosphatase MutT (NUDIX family) n=1 Tax=Streptomyces zagrosensis TaxID=1042984 RepID=A0A7W9V2E4_9ACTN|nr:NUDIX domain-containing protein [Streptomyces zagrosensis]MBB5940200.1 8-oxo-dGTP pyrophosphatase MutT (NUDIX family) [Streptomyces zagrosensis]